MIPLFPEIENEPLKTSRGFTEQWSIGNKFNIVDKGTKGCSDTKERAGYRHPILARRFQ